MAITNLQQARQMYALGQLVSKTMDGSRPGYRGSDYGDQAAGRGAYSGGPPGNTGDQSTDRSRTTKAQDANQRAVNHAAAVRNLETYIDRPNVFETIGTGIGNYIKGGGLLGAGIRGLGSLFDSFTGPKATEYGNLDIPGYNMLNIAGPKDYDFGLERGGEGDDRQLYAAANQYTAPTPIEEEGITTMVNNPDFIQRFMVKEPYRQAKGLDFLAQNQAIANMINNLYT
jgi:hypothetical protein